MATLDVKKPNFRHLIIAFQGIEEREFVTSELCRSLAATDCNLKAFLAFSRREWAESLVCLSSSLCDDSWRYTQNGVHKKKLLLAAIETRKWLHRKTIFRTDQMAIMTVQLLKSNPLFMTNVPVCVDKGYDYFFRIYDRFKGPGFSAYGRLTATDGPTKSRDAIGFSLIQPLKSYFHPK